MQLHITGSAAPGAAAGQEQKRSYDWRRKLGTAVLVGVTGLVTAVVALQPAAAEGDHQRGPDSAARSVAADGPMIENDFDVVREGAHGDNRFTVFRPADPAAAGGELPVLAFGNGACAHTDNSEVTQILTFIASKGFAVVDTGSADGSNNGVPSGQPIPSLLTDAITWAEQEQGRSGAALAGQLDLDKVATAGHSCGGIEALIAAQDARVSGVVSVNSGLFADGSLGGYTRDELNNLHTPVMFLDGGPSDIAYENSQANYGLVQVPAVLASNPDAGHGGFITGAQMTAGAGAAVSFLDMVLNDNAAAREYILDPSGIGSQYPWNVSSKNWPAEPTDEPTDPSPEPTDPSQEPTEPPETTSPPADGACTATLTVVNSWGGGYQGEVTITAGGSAIDGWAVTLSDGITPSQIWNGSLSGSTVTNVSWNGGLGAGQSASFGFIGSGSAPSTGELPCAA